MLPLFLPKDLRIREVNDSLLCSEGEPLPLPLPLPLPGRLSVEPALEPEARLVVEVLRAEVAGETAAAAGAEAVAVVVVVVVVAVVVGATTAVEEVEEEVESDEGVISPVGCFVETAAGAGSDSGSALDSAFVTGVGVEGGLVVTAAVTGDVVTAG